MNKMKCSSVEQLRVPKEYEWSCEGHPAANAERFLIFVLRSSYSNTDSEGFCSTSLIAHSDQQQNYCNRHSRKVNLSRRPSKHYRGH